MPIVRGFRRFHSNFISSSRQVATEILNLVSGSNVEQLGRSSATPFTSERPIRKRVPSADRKAMLESFVNKYRAMNLGKFPSTTSSQKEVGGSYYLIRKMLQEIEYDFKISSVEKGLVKENKKQTKGENTISREISTESSESQEVSNSQITIDQQLCKDPWIESVSNFDNNFELKEGLQPSTSSANFGKSNTRRDDTDNIATESHDTKGQCHEKAEQKPKDEFPLEYKFFFEDVQSKVEKQQDGIRSIATESHDTKCQCHEKLEQKPKDELPLEYKFFFEDLQSKVEKQQGGIRSIATESHDTKGQCHVKLEQKPKDEFPLEYKIFFEDLQSNIEKQQDGIRSIATESHDSKGQFHEKLEQKPEQKPKDDSPVEDKFVFEDSQSKVDKQHDGIRNIATESHDTKGQCHEKLEHKLEEKPIDESPEEDKFVFEDSQSKVEKLHDGIRNIVTESHDTKHCHEKLTLKQEEKPIDESPLEEKIVFEDSQSKVEKQHDGIRNIVRDMPDRQKDDELGEKPSLWGNLKSMATEFINMWKK